MWYYIAVLSAQWSPNDQIRNLHVSYLFLLSTSLDFVYIKAKFWLNKIPESFLVSGTIHHLNNPSGHFLYQQGETLSVWPARGTKQIKPGAERLDSELEHQVSAVWLHYCQHSACVLWQPPPLWAITWLCAASQPSGTSWEVQRAWDNALFLPLRQTHISSCKHLAFESDSPLTVHHSSLKYLEMHHFKQTKSDCFTASLHKITCYICGRWKELLTKPWVCLLLQSHSSLQAVLLNCKIHLPLEFQDSLKSDCLQLNIMDVHCNYTLLWSRLKCREELLLITSVMRL